MGGGNGDARKGTNSDTLYPVEAKLSVWALQITTLKAGHATEAQSQD